LRQALKDPKRRMQAAFSIWQSKEPDPGMVEPLLQALEDNPGKDFGMRWEGSTTHGRSNRS